MSWTVVGDEEDEVIIKFGALIDCVAVISAALMLFEAFKFVKFTTEGKPVES